MCGTAKRNAQPLNYTKSWLKREEPSNTHYSGHREMGSKPLFYLRSRVMVLGEPCQRRDRQESVGDHTAQFMDHTANDAGTERKLDVSDHCQWQ